MAAAGRPNVFLQQFFVSPLPSLRRSANLACDELINLKEPPIAQVDGRTSLRISSMTNSIPAVYPIQKKHENRFHKYYGTASIFVLK